MEHPSWLADLQWELGAWCAGEGAEGGERALLAAGNAMAEDFMRSR